MKNILSLLLLIIFFSSCSDKNSENKITEKKSEKKFEMYKYSEMAALMEQMFTEHKQLKYRIIKGDTLGKIPSYYSKIHTAQFTDESDNDAVFKTYADAYLMAQEKIYGNQNSTAKENFNNGVTACINCHELKCRGPIQRIKTLYIK